MSRRLASLLCLLALLVPAGAALARGPAEPACADACCEAVSDSCCPALPSGAAAGAGDGATATNAPCEDDCGHGECPAGCPDCACSARARIATASTGTVHPAPGAPLRLQVHDPDDAASDSDPREILHVPRG